MSIRKTHEEFVKEIKEKYNDEYSVIGNYINAKTKIDVKHNTCNKIFSMTPSNLLSGQQCPFCKNIRQSARQLMSNEEFKTEIFNLVGEEYIVKSEYKGRNIKVLFYHKKCNSYFEMTPTTFVNKGGRCTNKQCLHNRLSLAMKDSNDTFLKKFNTRSNGEYELLSKYHLSSEKIKIKHLVCKNIFEMKANNFIQGQGCPYCNISKAELKIRDFCEFKSVEYIWQKSFPELFGLNGGSLFYDFYFPNKKLLLEYQGEFHDGSLVGKCQTAEKLDIQQEHDRRKRQYAKDHNIKLLEIWYWDYENIEEILSRELGLTT